MRLTNKDAVEKALDEVQAKARARCLNYEALTSAATRAEKQLRSLGIPRRAWAGCTILVEPARMANSYRGVPLGTYAELEFRNGSWHVVKLFRDAAKRWPHGAPGRSVLVLTDAAKAAIKPLML